MLLSTRARDGGAVHALALVALMAGYAWAYRWNTFVPDTARDLVQALALAHGHWPANGPLIADRWVLSPIWFYVVAALASMARSPATLALLVGLLASTKIPLAWAVGRRFVGTRGALVFAALVALPGWTVLEHLVWSHTNFVQATALLALLALARWHERPSDARSFAALLALGVAMQAHPTNLVAALPFVAMVDRDRLRASARGVALGALACGLLAIPTVLHELGGAGMDAAARGTPFPAPAEGLAGLPALLVQIVLLPQQAPAFFLASLAPAVGGALRVASALIVALGLLGALLEAASGRRRRALALAAWTVAAVVLVALLRPWTPAYMAFAPQLAATALVAFGIAALLARVPRGIATAAAGAVTCLALATTVAWIALRVRDARAGMQSLPRMALIDVRKPAEALDPPAVMFTAADHARVVRAACRGELAAPVAGDLAAMLLMGQGAPFALAGCPRERWPVVGAAAPGAVAGVPRALAARAGLASEAVLAGFSLVPVVRPVRAAPAERLAYVTAYPPYALFELAPERVVAEVALAPGERLLASNLLVFFNPWAFEARVAGAPLAPVARSENTVAWACPDARGACTIRLALEARRLDELQAMVVPAR